jgi:hypothetical protein
VALSRALELDSKVRNVNGMIPPPKNPRWAISTDRLNQLKVIFRELLPNPGSGVAVNDDKRPKILHI